MKTLSLFFILFINTILFCQAWQKEVFIDIPGDNYDIDIGGLGSYPGSESYITWINKNDSVYSVYLKRISPKISNNILVDSDTIIKSKSTVAPNLFGTGVKIVWQNRLNNFYQIVSRNFSNYTLGNKIIIQDSLITNPQIALSAGRIVWVEKGILKLKQFDPKLNNTVVIDSPNCSSPDIQKYDGNNSTKVIYVKGNNGNHQIYLGNYNEYWNPNWSFDILSDGDNKNPNFNYGLSFGSSEIGASFEKVENQISRIKYSIYQTRIFDTTKNEKYNFNNPKVFSYEIPISPVDSLTPFFLVFDSDSIGNNKEIFVQSIDSPRTLINLSNMTGNDYDPKVSYMTNNDTDYVAIFWLHENNSKIDIWFAKEIFLPFHKTNVENEYLNIESFELYQNYPNPFNPSTTIQYKVEKPSRVKLKIYDVLGKFITTLSDNYESAGIHKVEFKGSDLSSGVYFYVLNIDGIIKTKSMILLK